MRISTSRIGAVLLLIQCCYPVAANGAAGPRSVLEQLTETTKATSEKTADGLRVTITDKRDEGKLLTAAEFRTPLLITAVVRSDVSDLRLYFGKHGEKQGMMMFNWGSRPTELRYRDPQNESEHGLKDKGAVPRGTFVAVRWIITRTRTRIEVDGVERGAYDGNFGEVAGTVGVGSWGGGVVTVKAFSVTPLPSDAAASANPGRMLEPIEAEVPSASPPDTKEPAPASDAIERVEFRDRAKRLTRSVTAVTAMMVTTGEDGQASGFTSDIIATVPGQSRSAKKAGVGFLRIDGDETMKTAFDEAVRAVTLRYPVWEPGHIDISFGEKFRGHGGPSAGVGFAILMLSALEGFEVDPKCAVTGDLTVDWKVRQVGGVTAKLRGATLDKCLFAVIPETNQAAFADMSCLYKNSAMWEIQVFSASSVQQALAVARVDRPANLTEAIKLFAELQPQLAKAEKATLQSPEVRKTLRRILELAPNHLSARQTLALAEGTAPTTLSANATIYQLSVLMHPYRALLRTGDAIDRRTLPVYVTALARKRLASLRPIANKELSPLIIDVAAYVEAMDGLAGKTVSGKVAYARAEAVDARFAALDSDPSFLERLVREGY